MGVKVWSSLSTGQNAVQRPIRNKKKKKSTEYKLSVELVMSRAMSNKRKHIVPSHRGLVGMKKEKGIGRQQERERKECESVKKKRQNRAGLI